MSMDVVVRVLFLRICCSSGLQDLHLYLDNCRDTDNDHLYMGMTPCLVQSSGWVMCISWSSFHTSCQSDFTHWPYDSHVCEAQLAPWVLHSKEVVLLPMNHDIVVS